MRHMFTVIAALLITGLSSNAMAQDQGFPPASADSSAAPAAPPSDDAQARLNKCESDLASSKGSAERLEKGLEACLGTLCNMAGHEHDAGCPGAKKSEVKPAAPPPPPVTCQMPDDSIVTLAAGHDCECGDPRFVAVVRQTFRSKVCVPKAVEYAKLEGRVAALEAKYGELGDLREQLAALQGLEGQHFVVLYNSIVAIVDRLNKLQGDVDGLRDELGRVSETVRQHGIWLHRLDDRMRVVETKLDWRHLVDVSAVTGFNSRGEAGFAGLIGGRLTLEDPLKRGSDWALVTSLEGTIAYAHKDNTFGTNAFITPEIGLRAYLDSARAIGVEFGPSATFAFTMSHGYSQQMAPEVGRAFGGFLGLGGRIPDTALNWGIRGRVQGGSENHLSGTDLAREYPAQFSLVATFGGTVGLF